MACGRSLRSGAETGGGFFTAERYRECVNKRKTWVRADKLQPGDRVQDTNGNIVTIEDVSKGLFPRSILIKLRDANPDFVYVESNTKIFVE